MNLMFSGRAIPPAAKVLFDRALALMFAEVIGLDPTVMDRDPLRFEMAEVVGVHLAGYGHVELTVRVPSENRA